jgi:hypothetical protein
MLQKFKITSCAFILVLFGFSLMTVSPVLAHNAEAEDLGDHTHEHEEAAVDDAEGTKEALKLQIEEISASLKHKDARIAHLHEQYSIALLESIEKDETIADLTDRFAQHAQAQAEFDATIAELQNQLSTAHSESEAQVELIADLQWQLATAIARAGEAPTGQDEVGRTQSSPGLWSDEAREHCSTSMECNEYLKQFTAKHLLVAYGEEHVLDFLESKHIGYNGDKWEEVWPKHYTTLAKIPYWLSSAYANTIPYSLDLRESILVECQQFDFDCLEDQADRAAAWVLYLGNKAECDNLPLCD